MVVAYVPRTPLRSSQSASSTPTSSPRSIRQPVAGRRREPADRAPVGVRVVGDDQVGLLAAGQRQRQVHRARAPPDWESHRRRSPGPARPARRPRAARRSRPRRTPPAPPRCPRRACAVCTTSTARAASPAAPGRPPPPRSRRRPTRPAPGSPTDSSIARTEPTARIGGLDLGVHRRHDLRAVGGIDLVAVVLRRVVRGGHHHPGRRLQVADREGQHRGRQQPGQQPGVEAGRCEHRRRVRGEGPRAVPAVVADHHDPPARPAAVSWAARPAAARRTTAAFMPFGPARSGPRRPAVPKASGPANRSASSARACSPSRPVQQRLQLGGVAGSGSSAIQSRDLAALR